MIYCSDHEMHMYIEILSQRISQQSQAYRGWHKGSSAGICIFRKLIMHSYEQDRPPPYRHATSLPQHVPLCILTHLLRKCPSTSQQVPRTSSARLPEWFWHRRASSRHCTCTCPVKSDTVSKARRCKKPDYPRSCSARKLADVVPAWDLP